MPEGHVYDLSSVGPHRRTEVLRRIGILDAYIAGEMTSKKAIEEFGMSAPSFWRMLQVWRQSRRPELIGASGRQRKPRIPISADQKRVIEEIEIAHQDQPTKRLLALAAQHGVEKGVKMPGESNIAKHIHDIRRSRGLRPSGIHDLIMLICAVDLPIVHPRLRVTASPLMSLLVDVGEVPVVLGLALTHDELSPALTARTILDAIAGAEVPRSGDVREIRLLTGPGPAWQDLTEAVAEAGLRTTVEHIRPRSSRAITPILGARPGGIRLFVDRTAKTADKRFQRLRSGAQTIEIDAAEDILKGRMKLAFPGARMAIVNDATARQRLSARLTRIAKMED